MTDPKTLRIQADSCLQEAQGLHEAGDLTRAIEVHRRAVLLYAAAENALRKEATDADQADMVLRRTRASACRQFGDLLMEARVYPEAATIYQEATDLYIQIGDEPAEKESHVCAQKVLASVAALRAQPYERLYLLIAHYERRLRQLELEAGTEAQQAACCVHIARVFQRRDRPQEAVARYHEALRRYTQAPQTEEIRLAAAECHHRIATLLALRLNDLPAAARHYRLAIALYTEYEPELYGEQSSRLLCERALADIEPFLSP